MSMTVSSFPGYWMHEVSGELRPAIMAYLLGARMTDKQVATMRAYLRQWINARVWRGTDIDELRQGIDALTSVDAIDAWLTRALDVGIDPL